MQWYAVVSYAAMTRLDENLNNAYSLGLYETAANDLNYFLAFL